MESIDYFTIILIVIQFSLLGFYFGLKIGSRFRDDKWVSSAFNGNVMRVNSRPYRVIPGDIYFITYPDKKPDLERG